MAESNGQEKTEQPTSKKLDDSRKEGKVAKSIEVSAFAVFTTGIAMVFLTQGFLSSRISNFTINIFRNLDVLTINNNMLRNFTKDIISFFIITIIPVFAALFIVSLGANLAQVGLKLSPKALIPKFDKLNPLSGMKKVFFSPSSLVELLKSLVKLTAIGWFTYSVLNHFVVESPMLIALSVPDILKFMVSASYDLIWKIILLYIVIAASDFIFQRKKFKKEMMMTKQEVKEETKQSEGDPLIKSRIKRLQYQSARKRMIQNVPKADVVITNPTHYAVALKYNSLEDTAPRVLAKGVDELAQRIKQIARDNNVPVHEDRQLARALYRICEVGDEIPSALFQAVAQVLAYVYQLKNSKKRKSIV